MTARRRRAALNTAAGIVAILLAGSACSSPPRRSSFPAPSHSVRGGAAASAPPSPSQSPLGVSSTPTPGAGCARLAAVVAGWPLARKAAELVAIPSLDFNLDQLGAPLAAGAGGVLFLGGGAAPADLASRVRTARALSPADAPALTMADEEGGGVQRLEALVGSIPWAREMASADTLAQVNQLATGLAQRLRAAGVSMDLAPVLDVDGGDGPNASDADGLRSFSALPTVASAYGVAFLRGLEAGGIIPVAKHFPGLGGATGNTDDGPAQTLPFSTLRTQGLPPFTAAIAAGAPAVMVANATVPGLSSQPASLSPAVIGGLLADQLHFRGLVLTDSLSAGAIIDAGYQVPAAAAAAVEAGADMVLFGSTLTPAQAALLSPAGVEGTFSSIVAAVEAAVASGTLAESRLDAAALHVLEAQTGVVTPCA